MSLLLFYVIKIENPLFLNNSSIITNKVSAVIWLKEHVMEKNFNLKFFLRYLLSRHGSSSSTVGMNFLQSCQSMGSMFVRPLSLRSASSSLVLTEEENYVSILVWKSFGVQNVSLLLCSWESRRDCAHGGMHNCDPLASTHPAQNPGPSLRWEMAVHLGLWKD